MNVLVTGASGFLGSHIAEQLSLRKIPTVALVRKSSNRKFLETLPHVSLRFGSVNDRHSINDAMVGVSHVIHAAGLVKAKQPSEFFRTNTDGTQNLLDAAASLGDKLERFVLVSSLAALGPSMDGAPVPDDADPNPVTHYGRSKLAAEQLVAAARHNVRSVIIRPPMIYGPRDNESFAFFQAISRGILPYLGSGKNTLSVVYAADCASACIRALEANVPSGSTYFVDDGQVYVWLDMLKTIEAAMGKRARLRMSVPFGVLKAAAVFSELGGRLTDKAVMLTRDKVNELSAPHWVGDSRRAQSELAWRPEIDWAEGTRRAAAWYRAEGWL